MKSDIKVFSHRERLLLAKKRFESKLKKIDEEQKYYSEQLKITNLKLNNDKEDNYEGQ